MSRPQGVGQPQIPDNAWTFTITTDGDTLWLECDSCEDPVCVLEPGDSLESRLICAREHRCARQVGAYTRKPTHQEGE